MGVGRDSRYGSIYVCPPPPRGPCAVVLLPTSRLRPNLSPRRGCPVSSGSLAPRPPAQMGRGGPKSAILTCCAPGGASIRAAWAIYGRDGLQGAPASLLERSKAPTPPGRTQMRVVYAFFEVYINFLLPGGGSDQKMENVRTSETSLHTCHEHPHTPVVDRWLRKIPNGTTYLL